MEGNIYNKISQEINFKLPDINFDSDSDELNGDIPIKPYIRPAAEILFGNEDSDSEEILNILSKLPQESDVIKKKTEENKCSTSHVTDKDMRCELPFNNIKLPSGLLHCRPSDFHGETEKKDKIILSKFGVRDNIDLDKILEDLDLSNYKASFLDEILSNPEDTKGGDVAEDRAQSELLRNLDEISKKYEKIAMNSKNNNCLQSSCGTSTVSLANLFSQAKQETNNKTIYLDLRVQGKMVEQTAEQLKKDAINYINHLDSEDSSDDETDEVDSNVLWIDNYRKSKLAKANSRSKDENDQKPIEKPKTVEIEIEKSVEKIVEKPVEKEILKPNEHVSCNGELVTTEEWEVTIPDDVKIKIDKIKHQEKILSERRYIVDQIKQLVDFSESCPLLLHEEISFEASSNHLTLKTNLESEEKYINVFISISSPNSVITISKVPSQFSTDHAKENFVAIISLILQSTDARSTRRLPFDVLGFQQMYYQNQLQLALLCKTSSSITKLRSDLKNITLRDLLSPNDDPCQILSNLPLSNILRIQPHDAILNDNIWQWNNASIIWHKLPVNCAITSSNKNSAASNINTSCMILTRDFYISSRFRTFLEQLLDRFVIAGLRYFHSNGNNSQLVLAIRGFDAINAIKFLQNTSAYKEHVTCTRFIENSVKELSKYFGPRLDEGRMKMMIEKEHSQFVVNEMIYGMSLYSSLYWTQSSDLMLLVSPLCLDIGWILNILLINGGYTLINIARLNVSISTGRLFGISEKAIDYFISDNGISHLLVLRNENPSHSLESSLYGCLNFMADHAKSDLDYDRFFYASSYSDSLVNILDLQRMTQTPEIRELTSNVPDAPFEDCEQCTFVLVISDELTRHMAQILDQMTNFDLLAVKCFSSGLSEDHMDLIKSQFQLRLPNVDRHSTISDSEARMRVGLIVVRSMYILRELEKIHNSIKIEKNLVFAYTMTTETTFRMIGSFFTSSELISDPRRRTALQFLPTEIVSNLKPKSILAQFSILYSNIEAVLVLQISNAESVLSKLRKLWFLLTRDGFSIVTAILDENKKLHFVVERPNAIFYLIQWIKSHFNGDVSIEFSSKPEDVPRFFEKLPSSISHDSIVSLNYNCSTADLIFVLVDCGLLESSVEMLSNTKIFWTFLEDNKYHCHGLSVINVDGSIIYKLRKISLRNLSGNQLQKETRYLCALLVGKLASMCGDLLKSSFDLMKSSRILHEDIYLNNDHNQILQCCNILLHGVVANGSNVNNSNCNE